MKVRLASAWAHQCGESAHPLRLNRRQMQMGVAVLTSAEPGGAVGNPPKSQVSSIRTASVSEPDHATGARLAHARGADAAVHARECRLAVHELWRGNRY